MTEMSETEKKRVADQRTLLGEEGLKSKRQRLDKATEDNEVIPVKIRIYFFHWKICKSNVGQGLV